MSAAEDSEIKPYGREFVSSVPLDSRQGERREALRLENVTVERRGS